MALISCPACNGSISDKAITCPHCGIVLSQFNKCEDCGTLFSKEKNDCPRCGCPVISPISQGAERPQKYSVKARNLVIIGIVIILIALIGVVGALLSSKNDSEKLSVPKNKTIICDSLSEYQTELIETIIRESVAWLNKAKPNDIVSLDEFPPKSVSNSLSLLKDSVSNSKQDEDISPAQYIVAEMSKTAITSPMTSSRAIRVSAESLNGIKEMIEIAIDYYY